MTWPGTTWIAEDRVDAPFAPLVIEVAGRVVGLCTFANTVSCHGRPERVSLSEASICESFHTATSGAAWTTSVVVD